MKIPFKRPAALLLAILLFFGQPPVAALAMSPEFGEIGLGASDIDDIPLGSSIVPSEIIEYTPEEMGLLPWDDPARHPIQPMGRMSIMAATTTQKINTLPSGTIVYVPYESNGSTWALPLVVIVTDNMNFGRGAIVRTMNAQGVLPHWDGAGADASNRYITSSASNFMNGTFYNGLKVNEYIVSLPIRYIVNTWVSRIIPVQRNDPQKVWLPSVTELAGVNTTVTGEDGYPFVGRTDASIMTGLQFGYYPTRSSLGMTKVGEWTADGYQAYYMQKWGGGAGDPDQLRVGQGRHTSNDEGYSDPRIVPYFMLSENFKVVSKGDGTYDAVTNSPPNAPGSITYSGAVPGQAMAVSCAAATDPDGDALTYEWEYRTNSGSWVAAGTTSATSTSITVPTGVATIQVRVRAKDPSGEYSDYREGGTINTNKAPAVPASITYINAISGQSMEVTCAAATDPDGDAITYLWESSVNGGTFTQFASTSTPKTAITVPASGSTLTIRVRARDIHNQYSAYRTGTAVTIYYPPSSPGMPSYGQPQAGQAIGITVTPVTHPNGLTVYYCWERSTDGGNMWSSIGESATPSITDYAPSSGLQYRIRVRTRDTNNQYSAWAVGDNKALNHAPSTPIYTEYSINYPTGKMELSWEASTDQNADTITYTVEGKIYGQPDYTVVYSGTDLNCAIDIPATGTTWLYRIMASDSNGGNSAYLYNTVTGLDRTAPTGIITGNAIGWTNDNVTLQLTASDTGGAGVRRVRVNGGAWVDGNTISFIATENGSTIFEIEDWAGNVGTVSETVNRIDKDNPEITAIAFSPTTTGLLARLANTLNVFNKQAYINITAADTLSGVAQIEYQLVAEGEAVDPGAWLTYSDAARPKIEREFKGYVHARCLDQAGNESVEASEPVITDETPPTGNHTISITDWTNHDVTIFVSTLDALSGVQSIECPDGSVIDSAAAAYTVSQNGTYVFILTDRAGNSTEYSVVISNIDKAPVTGEITPSTTEWTSQDVSLTFTAASVSGVRQVRVNGGEWTNGDTISVTATENGSFIFEAENNAGTMFTADYEVTNIDKGLPVVEGIGFTSTEDTLLSRLYQWLFERQVLINITTNTPASGTRSVEYQLVDADSQTDDTRWRTYTAGESKIDAQFSGVVAARMTNGAGTVSEVLLSDSIVIDDSPPSGTHTLSTTLWTNQDVTITVIGLDPYSGMASITLPDGTVVTGDTAEYVATENGTYDFLLTDFAGKSCMYSVTVSNIDKQPPVLPELPVENKWVNTNRPIEVDMERITAPSGVKKVQYNISSLTSFAPVETMLMARQFSFFAMAAVPDEIWHDYENSPIVVEEEGAYLVKLRALSNAGTFSPVDEYTVRNDHTPPIVSHVIEGDAAAPVIRVTAIDRLSGVAGIILPDGTKTEDAIVEFSPDQSGDYLFVAYDNAKNPVEYLVSATVTKSSGGNDRDSESQREGIDYTLEESKPELPAPVPEIPTAGSIIKAPAQGSSSTTGENKPVSIGEEKDIDTGSSEKKVIASEPEPAVQQSDGKWVPMSGIFAHAALTILQCIFSLLSLLAVWYFWKKQKEEKEKRMEITEKYIESIEDYNNLIDVVTSVSELHPELKEALEKEEAIK
ncbi:hypothetical protein U6B65_14755 (plasmid) [Oscillospiraceae bacterium MB08-C2-2]|nr:hypothetical protein U6B65_14755 [Oscillospiraceae bacterium MB08-C2-2]